jgi:proline iminopeptidase
MGGLAALGFTIERPDRVNQLVLVTSLSGFPAAARWGLPGSTFRFWDLNFWRIILWGMKLNAGRGSLELHKQLQNLMGVTSFHKVDLFTPVDIEPDDAQKGVPIRTIWSKNMYSRLSYADRLDEVQVPALILAGRHDPEAPLECSRELFNGIPEARLFVFEESGHSPFIEEPALFQHILMDYLWDTKVLP